MPHAAGLSPAAYTHSIWFDWDRRDTNSTDFLIGKALGQYELHTTPGGTVTNGLRAIPAYVASSYTDTTAVIQSGWNHVAVTYEGLEARVYINGSLAVLNTSIVAPNDLIADTRELRFGLRGDVSYHFDGRLDDIRL